LAVFYPIFLREKTGHFSWLASKKWFLAKIQNSQRQDTENQKRGGAKMASIHEILKQIVTRFQSGDVPEAVAYSIFPIPNIPSATWSMANRILMHSAGTYDARGIRQWREAGRRLKGKRVKPFHIIVPRIVKQRNGDGKEGGTLTGFMARPVFRVQDTVGEPIEYELPELPDLRLTERARQWGIAVHALPGPYRFLGCFDQEKKRIVVTSPDENVWFHELSHAAQERLLGKLNQGEDWKQEVVAELCAAALSVMVGKSTKHLGNNFRNICDFASKVNLTPAEACWEVLNDVEKVLRLILKGDQDIGQQQKALTGKIL
jgi:hypothetical protein